LNQEMSGVADKLKDIVLVFPARASETGKLYGSITTQMIAEAISKRIGTEINRRMIDTEPIRALGEHKMRIRLTVDLVPTVTVLVFREGEAAPGVATSQTEVVSPAAEGQPAPAPEEQAPAEAAVEASEIPPSE
jgi:large subunit ribosomal protein L9